MQILLVDTDTNSAGILEVGLRKSLSANIDISHHRSISSQGDYGRYDIAIVNHNLYDDSFSKCFLLKQRNPTLQTVVITSPGDSLRHLLSLRVNTDMIDEVVDKPVHFQTLARSFEALLKRRPLLMPDTWNATCPPA
jgi:DNA-binding response OmpR family regulator